MCGLCIAALLVVTPAAAQPVTSDRLDRFVKASQSRVGPADWQDLLYEIAKSDRVPETVTASFAKLIGVSRASALTYAAVIIESAIGDGTCEEKPSVKCPFAPGQPHYERAAAAGLADRTGNLLIVVGQSKAFTRNDAASFFALARKHRAAGIIFDRMYESTNDPAYLLATLQSGRRPNQAMICPGSVLALR